MSDSDLFNGVRGPAQGDKVSRRRLLELGAVGAAAVAGTGLLSDSGRAFAAAIEAGSLPYKANTSAKGSITFWHFWGSKVRRGAINSIIADFQTIYPGVTVNALYVPFGDIWTKNIAAVAAGTGMPDVIIEDRVQLRTRAKQHIDENLASMVKRDGINMGRFWPFTVVESVYNGDPYGLPYETDIRVLYYNKDQFKAAGLDPNRPPQNWNDLASYANKLDA